jgi:hypothetical protein
MEQHMKPSILKTSIVLTLFFSLLVLGSFSVPVAAAENQCFSCHTNPRKLIQITREIAQAQKGQAAKSSETEGEG